MRKTFLLLLLLLTIDFLPYMLLCTTKNNKKASKTIYTIQKKHTQCVMICDSIQFLKMHRLRSCLPRRSLASQLWSPFKYIASSPFRAFKAFAVLYLISVLIYLIFGTAVGYVNSTFLLDVTLSLSKSF